MKHMAQNLSISIQGKAEQRMLPAPSPRRGEGWGEGVTHYRLSGPPSPPPSPRWGEGVPPCRSDSSCSPTRSASTLAAPLICALALSFTANLAHAQGDPARGEKKFEDCAACHSLTAGENGVGPSLAGVVGRKAATLDDYRYSPALKRSNIVWSPQTLETFIGDPQKAVPANRMPYAGMTNAGERADLIAYLQKMSK
jgi:cytochrome c2